MSRFSPHQSVVNYNAGGKQDRLLLGILLMALGETLIVIAGAAIKHVTHELSIVEVVFFRSFFGLLVLLPLVFRLGVHRLKTQRLGIHVLRGLFGLTAMFCMFYSFYSLKLTEAILLKATSPIMLSVVAWLVLRERISTAAICAIILAFFGVVIIVNPSEFDPVVGLGFLAGMFSAFMGAMAKTMVRRLGQTENSNVIVFYFMLIASGLSLPALLFYWQTPTLEQWGWLFVLAFLSTIGQVWITKAFTVAKAAQVAMFTYLSMPVAGLLGWVFWDESITTPLVIGTLVIIAAGVLSVGASRR